MLCHLMRCYLDNFHDILKGNDKKLKINYESIIYYLIHLMHINPTLHYTLDSDWQIREQYIHRKDIQCKFLIFLLFLPNGETLSSVERKHHSYNTFDLLSGILLLFFMTNFMVFYLFPFFIISSTFIEHFYHF